MRGLLAMAALTAIAVLTAAMIGPVAARPAATVLAPLARSSGNYVLGCGGCHGIEGVSNPRLVPELRGQVGYFLATQKGREYLVRVPNVAFYTVSDSDLAGILNYMVFTIGGDGLPVNARPYTAAEVGALRKSPLTEVSLIDYRKSLVDDLIANHGAPASLRVYGNAAYD
jgi:mono/diheme cytochrome c family protein